MNNNKVFVESVKAFLSESRKKLEKGLSPQEKAHKRNVEAGGGAGPKIGASLRGARHNMNKQFRGVTGKKNPVMARTRGEYSKDEKGKLSDVGKSNLAAQLSSQGSSEKVKDAATKKWRKLNTSTEIDLVGAFIQRVLESSHMGLKGKQHKIDVDKDGKIEGSDLKALRKGKKKKQPPMKKK